ncbi:MAG: hypothetical protein K0R24_1364, partial [Gammaproteobacteria bacterium]|nr:hypothetical protein [Gammaproteobacteria bacterium]
GNWRGSDEVAFYKDEEGYNNAESISDSLARVIREYDEKSASIQAQQKDATSKEPASLYGFWTNTDDAGIKADAAGIKADDTGIKADDTGINALRRLLEDDFSFRLLEAEDDGLKRIEEIIERTSLPIEGNQPAQEAFDYLIQRVKYIRQIQKRTPYELTHPIKVLLIGDGWVRRAEEMNPSIRWINSLADPARKERLKRALQLQRRGYMPDQVYTIDCTWGQIPDYTSHVEDIPTGILPHKYFDIIYFEGMCFGLSKEAATLTSRALKVVLPSLKENGLILYPHIAEPYTNVNLVIGAKSGKITQEKLDAIPDCVKESVRRERVFDAPLFTKIAMRNVEKVIIPRKLITANQESGQKRKLMTADQDSGNKHKLFITEPRIKSTLVTEEQNSEQKESGSLVSKR